MQNTKKEKSNILYISSFGSLRGGGQRSLLLLLKYLDRDRFVPYLIVPEAGELQDEAQKLGVRVFIVPFPRVRSLCFWRIHAGLKRLKAIVTSQGINIIHTESPRETLYAGLLGRRLGVPVIAHLRVSETQRFVDRFVCRYADILIAVSEAVRQRSRCVSAGEVRVIYNGVELDRFRPSDPWGRQPRLRAGYFGRLHRRKGIEVLIRAALQSSGLDVVIVGDGDAEYLRELERLAAGSAVTFKPYQRDIREEMSNVDVVVLPSLLAEGFPRVVIEAMAMGKIVVVSDHPANREALGDAFKEFIVPVGDQKSLSRLLDHICAHRGRMEEVRMLLRKRAQECFDIRAVTKQIEAVYDELAARRIHG